MNRTRRPARAEVRWSRALSVDLESWQAAYSYAVKLRCAQTWGYGRLHRIVVRKVAGEWIVLQESLEVKALRTPCWLCSRDTAIRPSGKLQTHNSNLTHARCKASNTEAGIDGKPLR